MIALLRGLVSVATAAVLTGATAPPATVHIALREQPNTLNPLVSTQFDENYLTEGIFSGLTKLDDREQAQPDLAVAVPTVANGGISRDGRTIVYHLRPNARWHDGVPVTASDVTFTFEKIRDDRVPYVSRAVYDAVESVEARDAHTAVVHLARPEPDAPYELFVAGQNGEIVPRHLLEHVTDMLHAPFNAAPVGSGAYRFERWDRGSSITLRANAGYFGGPPAIDRIVVGFIPDSNTRALGVQSHDVDLAQIEAVNAPAAAATGGVRVVSLVQPTLVYLHFRVDAPPLNDVRLRRALSLAVDREDIARKMFLGQAQAATDIVPPQSPFSGSRPLAAPNPDAARRLLEQAGWRAGSDGIRQRDGRRLTLVLTCIAGEASNTRTAIELQSAWKAIGIEASLRPLPYNLLHATNGTLAAGDFSVALVSYSFAVTPDRSSWLSSRAIPPNGYNYARLRDPVLDRLINAAHYSLDARFRKSVYARINARVDAELPVFPVVWRKAVFAVSDRVTGIRPEPVNSDLWNAAAWRTR